MYYRPEFSYEYNIDIGNISYRGKLRAGFDPDAVFNGGAPELFTVPNARITYVENVTSATINTILLCNLFDRGTTTVISTELRSLNVLWSPEEGPTLGTSDIYENSTIEVYADCVILMKRSHVVKIVPGLEPIGTETTIVHPQGQQGMVAQLGVSGATVVDIGDRFRCVKPMFLSLAPCSISIQEYAIQARRSVDVNVVDGSFRNGPWYTIAMVIGRPDRVAEPLGIEVMPSSVTGFQPSPVSGSDCLYRSLSVLGLPSLSSYSLQWSDARGTTYIYEADSCINPIEVIIIS